MGVHETGFVLQRATTANDLLIKFYFERSGSGKMIKTTQSHG